jgi:hypothetical protein
MWCFPTRQLPRLSVWLNIQKLSLNVSKYLHENDSVFSY